MQLLSPLGAEFVRDRHLATLSTLLADGSPHVVPVGFTYDAGTVRIITNGPSQKVRNVLRDGRASVSQLDGARWLTLSGTARILADADAVANAVERYAARYRPPRANPQRVVIAIEVTRALGSAGMLLPAEERFPPTS